MIHRKRNFLGTFGGALIAALVLCGGQTFAATMNPNRVIDDQIFNNVNAMDAGAINNFLNQFSGSCISPNHGFSAPDPTGYNPSAGFQYGGNVSAGQVIADAAHAYDISPQVLLATLQKEQSLVTGGNGCSAAAYTGAMGYGCPDGGASYSYSGVNLYTINGVTTTSIGQTCVNTAAKAGFSQQVIHGAWLLKFAEQRSEGNISWSIVRGNWINTDDPQSCYSGPMTQGTWQVCPSGSRVFYDGFRTIDGQSVHMDTGATAALYDYTPHISGQQSFTNIFSGWFGAPTSSANNYVAQYITMSGYPTVQQGQSASVWIEYKNVGSQPWYDQTSVPIGDPNFISYATTSPISRHSDFQASDWVNYARPTTSFAAVYENDGTTLAANQHIAQPGEIVKWQFTLTAPITESVGVHQEAFEPKVEFAANWGMQGWGYFNINVTPAPYALQLKNASNTNITTRRSDYNQAWVEYQNIGTQPVYDFSQYQANSTANPTPLVLATTNPISRASAFQSSNWANSARPAINFAAVYESDGTTLAANQHVAQPGQIVKFNFTLQSSPTAAPNSYQEPFQAKLEFASTWNVAPTVTYNINVTTSQYAARYISMSGYPTVQQGQSAAVWIDYQNIGTATWQDIVSNPTPGANVTVLANTSPISRHSTFQASDWWNYARPSGTFAAVYESDGTTLAANQHVAAPGQIVKYAFHYTVPAGTAPGTYMEPIEPKVECVPNWAMGAWGFFNITVTS